MKRVRKHSHPGVSDDCQLDDVEPDPVHWDGRRRPCTPGDEVRAPHRHGDRVCAGKGHLLVLPVRRPGPGRAWVTVDGRVTVMPRALDWLLRWTWGGWWVRAHAPWLIDWAYRRR